MFRDYMLYTNAINVGGTHKYKIEGLTGGQTIIFKRQKGNLTVTTDGEYDIDWGTNYNYRYIAFGLVQESCNIKITIINSPLFTYTFTQKRFDVPCYRGFNTFWYGDVWLNIENFLSQFDSVSNKRKFYYTDDVAKFSNDISNKEHIIEVNSSLSGWAKEITIGSNADLITNQVTNNSNYMNSYRYDDTDTFIHSTFVGGSASHGSDCGLVCLACNLGVVDVGSLIGFAKCHIID